MIGPGRTLRAAAGSAPPYGVSRRGLLTAAAASLVVAWAPGARAQPKQAPPVIGWLSYDARAAGGGRLLVLFKESMAALGWNEPVSYVVEERWADGTLERLPALAAELAALRAAVIVTVTGQATVAAAKAAPRTPIVQGNGTDLVAAGLAASLARPGGMVTGMTNVQVDLTDKFVELLLAAAPKIKRVGFLVDSNNPNRAMIVKAAQRSAARHGVESRTVAVARADEIEPVLSRLRSDGAQSLIAASGALLAFERKRIIKFALAHSLPLAASSRIWAVDGALLSYGEDVWPNYRRVAYYVDRILKGGKPGDLPIEQPTKLELIVNLRTARALGLALPQELLLRADRVIE